MQYASHNKVKNWNTNGAKKSEIDEKEADSIQHQSFLQ